MQTTSQITILGAILKKVSDAIICDLLAMVGSFCLCDLCLVGTDARDSRLGFPWSSICPDSSCVARRLVSGGVGGGGKVGTAAQNSTAQRPYQAHAMMCAAVCVRSADDTITRCKTLPSLRWTRSRGRDSA